MNLTTAQTAAVNAAQAAGRLIRQNLRAAKKVNAETSHDIKLELDVRCQNLIATKLRAAFPEIALLGEEGESGAADTECRWVVDPIDGTVNFAYGIPHACVSIALQQCDQRPAAHEKPTSRRRRVTRPAPPVTVLGVVYDPFQDELWTAIRGRPARLNGRVIHVSGRRRLAECIVSIGFAKDRSSLELTLPYFTWLSRRVRKIRMMGSAALALVYVASGRFDAYIERGISLWDIAAGGLILECAGGTFWREPIEGEHQFRMVGTNGLLDRRLPRPR